jgi:transcriptional regulator with XRE-family HTH domain
MKENDLSLFIGNEIRVARARQRMSQAALARQMGISVSALSLYENGLRRLSIVNLFKIAKVLACQPADFLPSTTAIDIIEECHNGN